MIWSSVSLSFLFASFHLKVNASLDEQAFSESWGLKAKQVFSHEFLNSLPDPKDKKLIEKVMLLGAANLPQKEREEVCSCYIFCKRNFALSACQRGFVIVSLLCSIEPQKVMLILTLNLFCSITQFSAPWTVFIQQARCFHSQT